MCSPLSEDPNELQLSPFCSCIEEFGKTNCAELSEDMNNNGTVIRQNKCDIYDCMDNEDSFSKFYTCALEEVDAGTSIFTCDSVFSF